MKRVLTKLLVVSSNGYRRLLALVINVIGPRAAYASYGFAARRLIRLLEPLREQCAARLTEAFPERDAPGEIAELAEKAFVQRSWNVVDLMLANWRLGPRSYSRYGGAIPETYRDLLHQARDQRKPVILITAYYGPYDLLPLLLGYNGIPAAAVYLPHPNRSYDAFRQRVRSRSGCEGVPVERAAERLPAVLENGGAVAILSDHAAEKRGIPVDFLGKPTTAPRSVGLLAAQYNAVVAVAAIRRKAQPFRFEIVVSDYFEAPEWATEDDPVTWITRRYTAAIERIVSDDPAQYLWTRDRWAPIEMEAATPRKNTESPRGKDEPHA